ncbi:response regulator transcription factor [Ferruginibacter sp. HRS2-29]|uniref:response regulator transcription factor n=1 Tax=Ferruginibacter sp. HRS2-29 TaxID=2487334 RepID=UPI0020CCBFE1|nr:LuxR C-terminal-related transcriptional regulator [Ferruginibacter sp. HRS2-29]MCP9752559.1 DNA-binding response regulator [Ferruginibacter sp. HRS2-29]
MENLLTNLLTTREKEIIAEVSKGLYDKEIAQKIFISTETVKKHVKNIYKKLGVRNRVEASILYMFDHKNIA